VRSLAHDLGISLGTGAHLSALRRTRAGPWGLEHALPLATLAGGGPAASEAVVQIHALLPDLPAVTLSDDDARRVLHGRAVRSERHFAPLAPVRLLDSTARLVAVAEARPQPAGGAVLQPFVVVG
jgi:tRNA pseudouridine55 synthase